MGPLISIIIPNHNGVHLVAEVLKSVFAQDYQNTEIIIVDHSSSDGSVELLRTYKSKITLIESANLGAAAARNAGLLAATGTLAFIKQGCLLSGINCIAKCFFPITL